MKKSYQSKVSRRKFVGTTASLVTGMAVGMPSFAGAPALLRYYNKPNSQFKGVQVGMITYSFRSLPDQSAEATLKYIKECGISAIELMGDLAESFAGKPESTLDRRAMFGL